MTDLKEFAEQLVDLTVNEVNELKEILVNDFDFDSLSSCVIPNHESKVDHFVPRKFTIRKKTFLNGRSLLLKHRKIIGRTFRFFWSVRFFLF